MATEIECMHKDIEVIRKDLDFIKNILAEEFDLSNGAKQQLNGARKTPLTEYIDYIDVKKQLLK